VQRFSRLSFNTLSHLQRINFLTAMMLLSFAWPSSFCFYGVVGISDAFTKSVIDFHLSPMGFLIATGILYDPQLPHRLDFDINVFDPLASSHCEIFSLSINLFWGR
jgi:hypothetical protein